MLRFRSSSQLPARSLKFNDTALPALDRVGSGGVFLFYQPYAWSTISIFRGA